MCLYYMGMIKLDRNWSHFILNSFIKALLVYRFEIFVSTVDLMEISGKLIWVASTHSVKFVRYVYVGFQGPNWLSQSLMVYSKADVLIRQILKVHAQLLKCNSPNSNVLWRIAEKSDGLIHYDACRFSNQYFKKHSNCLPLVTV